VVRGWHLQRSGAMQAGAAGQQAEQAQQAPCWYAVLGVAPEASPEDIKRAYRQAALRLHPDKAGSGGSDSGSGGGNGGGGNSISCSSGSGRAADTSFHLVQQAWEVRLGRGRWMGRQHGG